MATTATSIVKYSGFFHRSDVRKILDYGAGTLRNAEFLAERGFTVYAADVPEQVHRILHTERAARLAGLFHLTDLDRAMLDVDLVVSTYVLNIIPDGAEKWRYLRNIVVNLRPGGYLLVEVACRRQGTNCGAGCSYHMKCTECVKTYSHEELDRLVAEFGFRRLCHYYRHTAVAAVYQLVSA